MRVSNSWQNFNFGVNYIFKYRLKWGLKHFVIKSLKAYEVSQKMQVTKSHL